jgi:hypothetical protein
MQYKTIVLELINQYPKLKSHLESNRSLLSTVEQRGHQLRESHLTILAELQSRQPKPSHDLLRQQAGEIAISQLQDELQAMDKDMT